MSRVFAGLIGGLVLSAVAALPASAATTIVLNFDDLTGDAIPMPAVYEGVRFQDFTYYDEPSDEYPAKSGLTALYSNYDRNKPGTGSTSIFSFDEAVRFDGAWFAGHLGVIFELYRDGQRVHSSNSLLLDNTMQFLASGYGGLVDEVRLYGNSGNWVMDDLTYTTGVTTGVPEPTSWAMLILGFGAAGTVLRRRRSPALA
jgi:hypothetical protein